MVINHDVNSNMAIHTLVGRVYIPAASHAQSPRVILEKKTKFTFFVLVGIQVWEEVFIGLHAVRLSGLDPSPTEGRLVASPLVLLTEQRVHAALGPLCGPPAVPE